jgi:hypothetical protein
MVCVFDACHKALTYWNCPVKKRKMLTDPSPSGYTKLVMNIASGCNATPAGAGSSVTAKRDICFVFQLHRAPSTSRRELLALARAFNQTRVFNLQSNLI